MGDKGTLMFVNETELEARENLIRYFSRYLHTELVLVNPAFKFFRIETPVVAYTDKGLSLRPTTKQGAYDASRELLRPQTKLKLPLVIWQHGKVFKVVKKQTHELYTLDFHVLYSKTTGTQYRPLMIRSCDHMLRKQCGSVVLLDEDAMGVSIHSYETDQRLAQIRERNDYWGGKCVEISFDMDTCTKVNINHEFGKIRRSPLTSEK